MILDVLESGKNSIKYSKQLIKVHDVIRGTDLQALTGVSTRLRR